MLVKIERVPVQMMHAFKDGGTTLCVGARLLTTEEIAEWGPVVGRGIGGRCGCRYETVRIAEGPDSGKLALVLVGGSMAADGDSVSLELLSIEVGGMPDDPTIHRIDCALPNGPICPMCDEKIKAECPDCWAFRTKLIQCRVCHRLVCAEDCLRSDGQCYKCYWRMVPGSGS